MKNKENDIYQTKLRELALLVFDGEYEKIDIWFNSNKLLDLKKLANLISNENYFFMFRSNITGFHSLELLDKEKENRIMSVIKNFDLKSQLTILTINNIDDLSVNIVKSFKKENNYKKTLKDNVIFNFFIAKLFFYKKFDELDAIENLLEFNTLNTEVNNFFSFKGEVRNSGFSNIQLFKPEKLFKLYLIDRFSEEKLNYLSKKKIINSKFDLIETTNIISENINSSLQMSKNDIISLNYPEIKSNIEKDKKKINYFWINSSINNTDKNTSTKKIKI